MKIIYGRYSPKLPTVAQGQIPEMSRVQIDAHYIFHKCHVDILGLVLAYTYTFFYFTYICILRPKSLIPKEND